MSDAALQRGNAVADPLDRQTYEICQVGKQIQRDDEQDSDDQAERQISPRIFHFTGGERHIVPGVG